MKDRKASAERFRPSVLEDRSAVKSRCTTAQAGHIVVTDPYALPKSTTMLYILYTVPCTAICSSESRLRRSLQLVSDVS